MIQGETSLDTIQMRHCAFALLAFALSCSGSIASAQSVAKLSTENWRPKDGGYGVRGKGPDALCEDLSGLDIRLTENRVAGYEWSCDVTKITDTAPGHIRLDMTCTDVNLALFLHPRDSAAEERPFKEVMLLNKIDEEAIFIRKTSNGRFRESRWRASYCPGEQQQRADPSGKGPSIAPIQWPSPTQQGR